MAPEPALDSDSARLRLRAGNQSRKFWVRLRLRSPKSEPGFSAFRKEAGAETANLASAPALGAKSRSRSLGRLWGHTRESEFKVRGGDEEKSGE
ncbi:unnamed protein product [Bursaphelenchus xylophilus]|uniref:(pine wood nematode) hypothetical protein n=1 Tax=Bursaphelenchus xylophilus TaxID=6326 RepID=A0A1I7SR37_BURXY|nr:unnamed protein product [Bursaphelenchus xylophilus]CAG9110783.1 unnamed protein product [Bursaphelenchus xylophilus]